MVTEYFSTVSSEYCFTCLCSIFRALHDRLFLLGGRPLGLGLARTVGLGPGYSGGTPLDESWSAGREPGLQSGTWLAGWLSFDECHGLGMVVG